MKQAWTRKISYREGRAAAKNKFPLLPKLSKLPAHVERKATKAARQLWDKGGAKEGLGGMKATE